MGNYAGVFGYGVVFALSARIIPAKLHPQDFVPFLSLFDRLTVMDGKWASLMGGVFGYGEGERMAWWERMVQTSQYRSKLKDRVPVLLGWGVEVYCTSTRPRKDKGIPRFNLISPGIYARA